MNSTIKPEIFDRGPRPLLRGHLHSNAAWFAGGAGTALIAVAGSISRSPALTAGIAIYVACLVAMLAISATYHRFPWRSERAVNAWRRADHGAIAVFIAGTYTPVLIGASDSDNRYLLLALCWVAALAAVAMNLFWINHPRWLSVTVYLVLGWVAVFDFRGLYEGLSTASLVLIVVGGVIYSLGAIGYALRWPNLSARYFGFHEVFHAATIVAATLHHVAIWLIAFAATA